MAAGQASVTGPTVTLVQLPNGQTVQVHGVIQAAQPSVIQSPHVQAVQVCGVYRIDVDSFLFVWSFMTGKGYSLELDF